MSMRRQAIIVVLVAALFVPAFGQMRGGAARGFGGHGFARGFSGRSFGNHGFGGFRHNGIVIGSFHSGVRFRTGFPGHFHHFRGSYGYYPYAYYGYPYYGDYDYSAFSSSNYSTDDAYQRAAAYYNSTQQLSGQIDRLSDEVAQMREEQEARAAQATAPAAKPAVSDQPTILAFRDGHKEEVKNYAIVGQTLWILSDQRAKKLALTDLDVPATTKLNDERGSDFQLPE